jgi:4-hydroxymandelate oxidase
VELLNLFDYEEAAAERLDPLARDYYASGACDEITVKENRRAFERLRLRYRVLRDVSERQAGVEILGDELAFPVLVAPTAFQRLACEDGELATARAAGAVGTTMMLSTLSTTSMERVVEAAPGPVWFQLYVYRDRSITRALVDRARDAGCTALVLTVDAPLMGRRERDVHNRFRLPEGMELANLLPEGLSSLPRRSGESGLAAYVESMFDPSLDWDDLSWLVGHSDLPVLVKGIVHPEDARLAVEHGASGVIVSNHGGRQLDTSVATVDALPSVATAVEGRVPVLLDGGVRRGTDVLKAVALGASAVAVGRPVLWGLAVDGASGARAVLDILRDEIDLAMALCGCPRLSGLDPDLVVPPGLLSARRPSDRRRSSSRPGGP